MREMENVNKKATVPDLLYSPSLRAALSVYSYWCNDGKAKKIASFKAYERLKGIRGVLTFDIMRASGQEKNKLLEEYITINNFIKETGGHYFDERSSYTADKPEGSQYIRTGNDITENAAVDPSINQ
jgi:hypothetical protein